MKRAAILIVILLLLPAALAEGLGAPEDYMSAFDASAYGDSAWIHEVGEQLISLAVGDDAVISLCAQGGQLLAISVTAPQSEDFAVLAEDALAGTGYVSEGAVRELLDTGTARREGALALETLSGGARIGVYLYDEAAMDRLCWLPMHGGEKRHSNPRCSGMDLPRLITVRAAEALGFGPCEICAGGAAANAIDNAA